MDTILNQLKSAAASASVTARRSLVAQLQALQYELEEPNDAMERIFYLNCQMSIVRLGTDLKIFKILSESQSPLTVSQLAEKTGADPVLVGRVLRYLACTGYIKEEGQDLFSGNRLTANLALPNNEAGIHHFFDFLGPIYQSLPDYLEETKYKNITDATKTPLHYAWKTDLMPWDWFQTQPKKAMAFGTWAASRMKDLPPWIPTYPLDARAEGVSPESPLFVDVGSGFGQQSQLVRSTYPNLKGNVIIEDFPAILENAPVGNGITKLPHDFFQPQPAAARGARFYYLRQVLHDHSDQQATLILKNLKDAMGPDSYLLIDEIVIPNIGGDWQGVHMDMVVMAGLAGMERSKAQWDNLLKGVGLKVAGVYPYNPRTSDAILEVVAST